MKKALFIDRDGTVIYEPDDFQVDSLDKLRFLPGVITHLRQIAEATDFNLVMVTNQDGLGGDGFPESAFWPAHNFVIDTLAGEGIGFADVFIDRTFEADNALTRKPGVGMLSKYVYGPYDLANSYVIGDRPTDIQLAKNLGCKAIFIRNPNFELADADEDVRQVDSWEQISRILVEQPRRAKHRRTTLETDIEIELDLDGGGKADISTGIPFFDHMLDQLARHGGMDLWIKARGDLHVDEHHTVEDVAIALGEAFSMALGSKRGIERYGFCLPMDDCLAQAAVDLGGRSWIEWDAEFKREMIGGMPTEMFFHFFKSFSDKALCNLNVRAEGTIEHHKIEAIFKAFARSLKAAVKRDGRFELPSTKGLL